MKKHLDFSADIDHRSPSGLNSESPEEHNIEALTPGTGFSNKLLSQRQFLAISTLTNPPAKTGTRHGSS